MTKEACKMTTKNMAATKPHFQVLGDSLTPRKFSRLILAIFPLLKLPLKNFQYAHKAKTMGRPDQGGVISNSMTVQMAIPTVLTRNPEKIDRINNGSFSQFFKTPFVPWFFFI